MWRRHSAELLLGLACALGAGGCHSQTPPLGRPGNDGNPPNACVPVQSGPIESAWPTVGGGASGQRRSSSRGPAVPTTRWVFELSTSNFQGIAVGPDQTVYATVDNGVYAIGAQGHRHWFRPTMPTPGASPVLAPDGTVYVRTFSAEYGLIGTVPLESGGLLALDRCGQPRWTFHAIGGNAKAPTLGREGMVYTNGYQELREGALDSVHALGGDGRQLWAHAILPEDAITTSVPVVDAQGTIYAGSNKGLLYALSSDGKVSWIQRLSPEAVLTLAVSDEGQVYAATARTLVAVGRDGPSRWQVPVHDLLTGLALAEDGTVYYGDARGLHALSPDGTPKWSFTPGGIAGAPSVAKDGTVYVPFTTRGVGQLYAVDSTGTRTWLYYLEPIRATALGGDGTLYAATARRLYALTTCSDAVCPDDGSTVSAVNLPPAPSPGIPAPPAPARSARWSKHERRDGYDIYFGCGTATAAIVRDKGNDFSWYPDARIPGPMKQKAVREDFRARAAGVSGIAVHATGFGSSCLEPRGAFMLMVHPGQALEAAAHRVGEWLVRENLRGEIDLVETPLPVNH
jgi:outer membrane protein assembly factor BamB